MARKLIGFDPETLQALELLSQDSGKSLQELADEAFADLLTKATKSNEHAPWTAKDRTGDQVPIRIEVDWIDGLNVQDVLRVVSVANIEVRIVIFGDDRHIREGQSSEGSHCPSNARICMRLSAMRGCTARSNGSTEV